MGMSKLSLQLFDMFLKHELTELKKQRFIYENQKILEKILKYNKLKNQKLKKCLSKYLSK